MEDNESMNSRPHDRAEETIEFQGPVEALNVLGVADANLARIRELFRVEITSRGERIVVTGDRDQVDGVMALFEDLMEMSRAGQTIGPRQIEYMVERKSSDSSFKMARVTDLTVKLNGLQKRIQPKTQGQRRYMQSIRDNDIVFGIGPAGTGKTYLAVAMAVEALLLNRVRRIVLARPAVEAGESLGFLPGDLMEKINPYLRPLYDSLYDILGIDRTRVNIERGVIEIAPLAYMRGRTLNDSMIILDEAQNTTSEQMMMFLTRLGISSKAVVTGDVTQIDLPRRKASGLIEAAAVLGGVEGIEFAYMDTGDIVRHSLVQKIVSAYEEFRSTKEVELDG